MTFCPTISYYIGFMSKLSPNFGAIFIGARILKFRFTYCYQEWCFKVIRWDLFMTFDFFPLSTRTTSFFFSFPSILTFVILLQSFIFAFSNLLALLDELSIFVLYNTFQCRCPRKSNISHYFEPFVYTHRFVPR